jgi:hypothetical protein
VHSPPVSLPCHRKTSCHACALSDKVRPLRSCFNDESFENQATTLNVASPCAVTSHAAPAPAMTFSVVSFFSRFERAKHRPSMRIAQALSRTCLRARWLPQDRTTCAHETRKERRCRDAQGRRQRDTRRDPKGTQEKPTPEKRGLIRQDLVDAVHRHLELLQLTICVLLHQFTSLLPIQFLRQGKESQ